MHDLLRCRVNVGPFKCFYKRNLSVVCGWKVLQALGPFSWILFVMVLRLTIVLSLEFL